jgi:predicted ATPase
MINCISLRNFKCFESQEIALGGLTLLAGLNGMGKSSTLQALLLVRQSYLDGALSEMGIVLNGSLVRMGTAQDVLYEHAQSEEFEIGLAWDDGVSQRFILQYSKEADVLKAGGDPPQDAIFDRSPFTDAFHYLSAERLGPRTSNAVSDYQVREHRQVGTIGEYTAHFLHVYGSESVAESMLHPDADSDELKGQVQAWLREISPGTEIHVSMHSEMDIANLRYSFVAGRDRSNQYRSTSVGFGISYALPLLVALLSSPAGGLVLLENPEAHLHPHGQVQIGNLLARAAAAGIQVVVETHSDHILNGMRLAVHSGAIAPQKIKIHYFSRGEKDGHSCANLDSPNIDRDGRLDRWPEGFFDEWDKSLECLLEPAGE